MEKVKESGGHASAASFFAQTLQGPYILYHQEQGKGGAAVWGRNWCPFGICALALGLAIFIVAIFPVGFLMFLVALLLIVCGWGCIRRR